MESITVRTSNRCELKPINSQIQEVVTNSGIDSGLCTIFVPHTTAGITINENADPDVVADMVYKLDKLIPWADPNYQHLEGNSAAHLKASLVGVSISVIVNNRKLQLGTWQGIYFCEFDGPRTRKVNIKVMKG